jgi:hypothetical protein
MEPTQPLQRTNKEMVLSALTSEVTDWSILFEKIDHLNEAEREECQQEFIKKNLRFLQILSSNFGNTDLVEAAKIETDQTLFVRKGASSVLSLPAATHCIAINQNGSRIAICYANALRLLTKDPYWISNVFEKKYRYPVTSMGFKTTDSLAISNEFGCYLLNTKTHEVTSDALKNPLLSHDGQWLMHETGDAITFAKLSVPCSFSWPLKETPIAGLHINLFAADQKTTSFVLATANKLFFTQILFTAENGITFRTRPIAKAQRPKHIADVDISRDGKKTIVVGNKDVWFYRDTTITPSSLPTTINAVRFNPKDDSIILGSTAGILLCDPEAKTYRKIVSDPIRTLALSEDGLTLAAASDRALFITSCHDLLNLSLAQHILIQRLGKKEKPESIFSDQRFVEIFKGIKNAHLKQKMVKEFEIEYKKLGYEECSVCNDQFMDTQLHCVHSFCIDCIEKWQKDGTNSCPHCRKPIVLNQVN